MYSKKVMYHFRHPKNMGVIKNPDGVATVGNAICGDIMKMYVKIGKPDYIKDIKFQTLGCAAAIATSSITTQLVKGKPISFAKKLSNDDVIKALGGLPKTKIHCSLLAVQAIKKVLVNYEKRTEK